MWDLHDGRPRLGLPDRVPVEPRPQATLQGTGEGYVVVTQHPSSVRNKSPRMWRLRGPSLWGPSPAAGKCLEREALGSRPTTTCLSPGCRGFILYLIHVC